MKLSKRQLSFFLVLVLSIGLFVGAKKLMADSNSNVTGYAWSSNIGWIKMNNCDSPTDSTTCTGPAYGVSIMPVAPGTITGYAWSSNIGWITFNDSNCPVAGCSGGAHVDWANKNPDGSVSIKGWARACSVYVSGCEGALQDNSILGGWDGYIALDSASAKSSVGTWGLRMNADKTIGGYAWGSQVIGWIKSITMSVGDSTGITVSLAANPDSIKKGESSTLTVTATNIGGANACSIVGEGSATVYPVTMAQNGAAWTGSIPVSPIKDTEYTVTCSNSTTTAQARATVIVTYFNTPPTDPGCTQSPCGPGGPSGDAGNGGYCAITNPQLTWNSTASSCTLTRQGGASVTVAGSSKAAGGAVGTDGLYYYSPNLPVSGPTTTYTLQCGSGSSVVTLSTVVNRCVPDYSLIVTPSAQSLVPGADGTVQTVFTVTINPANGFSSPVDLSVASWPANIPGSRAAAFSVQTLTANGGAYNSATLTITVLAKDIKTKSVYTPVIVQSIGGTITRQVGLTLNADAKTKPTYNEF